MKKLICYLLIALLISTSAFAEGEITISFIGDCSPGDSVQYLKDKVNFHTVVAEHGYAWPFSLLIDYLQNDDLTVANNEVTYTTRKSYADKPYPLKADPANVQVLTEGSV